MSTRANPLDFAGHPAVRNYLFVCLTALAVILLVLLRLRFQGWSFFPVLIGVAGVLLRWRLAPFLTLLAVAGPLFIQEAGHVQVVVDHDRLPPRVFSLTDWILCGALLAYIAAHY